MLSVPKALGSRLSALGRGQKPVCTSVRWDQPNSDSAVANFLSFETPSIQGKRGNELAVISCIRLCRASRRLDELGDQEMSKAIMPRPTRREPLFGNQGQEKLEQMARTSTPRESFQRPSFSVSFGSTPALWITLAFLLLLFMCPLLFENRSNECSALETKLVTAGTTGSGELMVGTALQGLSNGAIASAELAEKFPSIPTPISCTYEYWVLTFDPGASI